MLKSGQTGRKKDLTCVETKMKGVVSWVHRWPCTPYIAKRSKIVQKPVDLLIRKFYMSFEKTVFQVSNGLEGGLLKAEWKSRGEDMKVMYIYYDG